MQDLGTVAVVDYRSPSVIADLKAAAAPFHGVDVILDCVSSGASQTDIFDVLSPTGSRRYAAVVTGVDVVAPAGVQKIDASAYDVPGMRGGKQVLPALTALVEDGIFPVPLPVRVVGHGLGEVPNVLDEVSTVSGEKVVVTI